MAVPNCYTVDKHFDMRTVAMHYEDRLQLTLGPRRGCHDVEDQSVNAMVLCDPINPPSLNRVDGCGHTRKDVTYDRIRLHYT